MTKILTVALWMALAGPPAAAAVAQNEAAADASADASANASAEPVRPFSAHYEASWKGINIGTSEIALKKLPEGDQYLYTWTITARGIFKLASSDD
jgi:hypothetical protein